MVTEPDPDVTEVPALPLASPKAIVYPIPPSPSPSPTATVQVHPAALPEAVLVPASIAFPAPSVKAHVGAVVTSELEVNTSVTVSALLALPAPLTDMAGVFRVG